MKNQPPGFAKRFLRWYCNSDLLEEIEGDIYELFDRRIEREGAFKAKIKFTWDVLRFFRLSNMKFKANSQKYSVKHHILFQSFLKSGMRNISKNVFTSFISIIGLAIALGLSITSLIFYDIQVNLDQFHVNGENIYQVTQYVKTDEGKYYNGKTPALLGPTIASENKEVKSFIRIEQRGAYVSLADKTFEEKIAFVDAAYFKEFDFEFLTGSRTVLENRNNVVISYQMAEKYFPNDDPIGQQLSFMFEKDQPISFTVSAVMAPYSDYASFSYDLYLSIENLYQIYDLSKSSWEPEVDGTFIVMNDGSLTTSLSKSGEKYTEVANRDESVNSVLGLQYFALYDLSENSQQIRSAISWAPPAYTRYGLAFIALMLLLLAIFNYINISIVSSTRRLKEIAIRKVIGSNRTQVMLQFMIENVVLCLFAFLLGYFLSYAVFTPGLDHAIPLNIPFSFSSWEFFMLPLIVLFVFTAFLSGSYPAYYISRFESSVIMKGSEKLGKNNLLSRILLGFQLSLGFIMIISSLIFYSQSLKIMQQDWGYDPENKFVIRTVSNSQTKILKQELSLLPSVVGISESKGQIAMHNLPGSFDYDEVEYECLTYFVDSTYHKNLDLEVILGSWFTNRKGYNKNSVVINEAFARKMQWSEPLDEQIRIGQEIKNVIGVVKNFKNRRFTVTDDPVMFQALGEQSNSDLHYLTINIEEGKTDEVLSYSKQLWQEIAPGEPYVAKFQESVYDSFFNETRQSGKILLTLSVIAIFLSSMGLFGLLSFNIQKRLKEFSIRKVLGAGPGSIVKLLFRQYIFIILIAIVAGTTIGNLLIDKLLYLMFRDQSPVGIQPYILAFTIVLGTIFLTVAGEVIKATNINPVKNLRSE